MPLESASGIESSRAKWKQNVLVSSRVCPFGLPRTAIRVRARTWLGRARNQGLEFCRENFKFRVCVRVMVRARDEWVRARTLKVARGKIGFTEKYFTSVHESVLKFARGISDVAHGTRKSAHGIMGRRNCREFEFQLLKIAWESGCEFARGMGCVRERNIKVARGICPTIQIV